MTDKLQLETNIYLGEKLARLEMLWGNNDVTAKKTAEVLKTEIRELFKNNGYYLDESSYPKFIQNIFNIYNNTANLTGYVGVLIGRCIGQIVIFKNVSEEAENYEQIQNIIASNIYNIPETIIDDRDNLLKYLTAKFRYNDFSSQLEDEVHEYLYTRYFKEDITEGEENV